MIEGLELGVIITTVGATMKPVIDGTVQELKEISSLILQLPKGKLTYLVKRRQLITEHNLNKLKIELEKELLSIPTANIIEPPNYVITPLLEAITYSYDSEFLMRMYAKLLSGSMDSRTTHNSHPAFIEIIKQLSPLDALNMTIIAKLEEVIPVAYPILFNINVINAVLFMNNPDSKTDRDYDLDMISISNLIRLGLVVADFTQELKGSEKYAKFMSHPLILESNDYNEMAGNKNNFARGILLATAFGKSFCDMCISKDKQAKNE